MIRIRVEGVKEVQDHYRQLREEEIPFVTALSLTRTVQAAQGDIRQGLGARFTLRRKSFLEAGVRIKAAKKQLLEAVVQDVDPFMDLQQEGGAKTAGGKYLIFSWGNFVGVPLKGARPRPRALVQAQNYPAQVMARGGFIKRNADGTGIMYLPIFKRSRGRRLKGVGMTTGGSWSRGIMPMYALVPRVQVKKRWDFVEQAQRAVESWPERFDQAWKEVVKD